MKNVSKKFATKCDSDKKDIMLSINIMSKYPKIISALSKFNNREVFYELYFLLDLSISKDTFIDICHEMADKQMSQVEATRLLNKLNIDPNWTFVLD